MSAWPIPAGMVGDPHLLRVYAGAVREDDDCSLLRAVKTRPGLRPASRQATKPADLEPFPLEPVMRALDLLEFYDMSTAEAFAVLRGTRRHPDPDAARKTRPVHPGLMCWAEQAVAHYQTAVANAKTSLGLRPESRRWVKQVEIHRMGASPEIYELCAWGRRYASPDGSTRELRLLRLGAAGTRDRAAGEVELAAHVAAYGGLAAEAPWGQPHRIRTAPVPARVRVVEVGCADGSIHLLFDDVPAETEERYRQLAAPRLRATVDATQRRAGRGCAACRITDACSVLRKAPGILGIADTSRPRRTLSVTDLRRYQQCPAQEHLRRLKLPRDRNTEYGPKARRGKAVHEWLRHQHDREGRRPCTIHDAPDHADWSVGEWHVTGTDAELGARLIAKHVAVCPLKYADPDGPLHSEPVLTFHDTDADTIIIAEPDLLYLSRGSWVWREVKTTKYPSERGGKDILDRYPQAALAVVLLAEGALGGDVRRSRVELEILRPTGPDLEIINPGRADRVAKAREVLRTLAAPWHADRLFTARPGAQCGRCEVAQWCPDAQLDPPTT